MLAFSLFDRNDPPVEIEPTFRSTDFFRDISLRTRRTLRVLVVVDTAVGFTIDNGFGVGRFIKLLRETEVGCTRFEVDIAHRPFVGGPGDISFEEVANPGPDQAKYIDFRFDSVSATGEQVLGRYHEVFLFGFAPDNDAGTDANIFAHPWYSTDAELSVLLDWMNAGGGVFATGDHDYLGASMCHRIPRVGTMRCWTNADGVPPIDGPTRLDTNQPANPEQAAGTETILVSVERDATPQRIEWVPQRVERVGRWLHKYPHPLLCHPAHGVIDVMPDHPHEGRCREPQTIDVAANVAFRAEPEYPTHNGVQPKPVVVAWGNIVPRPNHEKLFVHGARFPMISAYDGSGNGSAVGRVVVDSTWHHWFNMNILGLEADTADKSKWEKVARYFVNVALWIAPKNTRAFCIWEFLKLHFEYTGLREINRNTPTLEAGAIVREALFRRFGKCWVKQFVLTHICEINPALCRWLERFDPRDELDWPIGLGDVVQPNRDVLESAILGHIYRGIEPVADELRANMGTRNAKQKFVLRAEELEKIVSGAAATAMKELQTTAQKEFAELQKVFA